MVWLLRPPYLRYAAAAVLVLGALWLDFRPTPEVDHPFLTVPVPAGAHRIALRFERPWYDTAGALLSGASLLVLGGLLWRGAGGRT